VLRFAFELRQEGEIAQVVDRSALFARDRPLV